MCAECLSLLRGKGEPFDGFHGCFSGLRHPIPGRPCRHERNGLPGGDPPGDREHRGWDEREKRQDQKKSLPEIEALHC